MKSEKVRLYGKGHATEAETTQILDSMKVNYPRAYYRKTHIELEAGSEEGNCETRTRKNANRGG